MSPKIFLISNMYPSPQYPACGTFVKSFKEGLQKEGFEFPVEALIKGKHKGMGKVIAYAAFFFNVIFKGLVYKGRYDLIYIHYINHSTLPFIFLNYFIKKPYILNAHGGDVLPENKVNAYLQRLTKHLVPNALLVVVPSEYYKQLVCEKFFINDLKVFVSPSGGLDLEVFYPDTRESKFQKEKLSIGFVGRLIPGKGWEVLLYALALLKGSKVPFKALIVGSGPSESEFFRLIQELELQDVVEHHGAMAHIHLRGMYIKMDVMVFPTTRKSESLGLVGLEAMACGTPVIGSNIGGITSYLKDSYNGYIFNPGEPTDLFSKIDLFYSLTNLEKLEMSKRALETANTYNKDGVMKKLANVLISSSRYEC